MSATTDSNETDGQTGLAPPSTDDPPVEDGDDYEEDIIRDCPHECHGTLTRIEDEVKTVESSDNASEGLICPLCRCTPDGTYFPPADESRDDHKRYCSQYTFFSGGIELRQCQHPDANPKGKRPKNTSPHPWADNPRETYRNSRNIRVLGGFTEAWPHEMTSREGSLL